MEMVSGMRMGGFLILVDTEGCRHALKLAAVLGLHEADPCGDRTLLTLTGGRIVSVSLGLETVLGWFGA